MKPENPLHISVTSNEQDIIKLCTDSFGTENFTFDVPLKKFDSSLVAFIADCKEQRKTYDSEGNYLYPYKIMGYYSFSDYHMRNKSIRMNYFFE